MPDRGLRRLALRLALAGTVGLLAAGCAGSGGTATPAAAAGAARPYFAKAMVLDADRSGLVRILETEIRAVGGSAKARCLLDSIPAHVNVEVLRLSIGQTAIDNGFTDLTAADLKEHAAPEIARDPRGVAYDQDRYAAISRACGL